MSLSAWRCEARVGAGVARAQVCAAASGEAAMCGWMLAMAEVLDLRPRERRAAYAATTSGGGYMPSGKVTLRLAVRNSMEASRCAAYLRLHALRWSRFSSAVPKA